MPIPCLTLAEAARIAGVSRQRIHALVNAGQLGTVQLRPAGRYYVTETTLRRWMAQREEQARHSR